MELVDLLERNFLKIGFIDYLERKNWWPAKEFFYKLIKLNAEIYSDNSICWSKSLRLTLMENRGENCDYYEHNICEIGWEKNYFEIKESEKSYLDYIKDHDILFSYEISPSVKKILQETGKKYCEFRISPIRFLPDLLIAINTNDPLLKLALRAVTIKISDIKSESSKLKVMYQHYFRSRKGMVTEPRAIFVGQTQEDSSLYFKGKIHRIEDFLDEIKQDILGRRLCYIPHPSASQKHIEYEMLVLKTFTGHCEILKEASYSLLCNGKDDLFIGISSGFLQEAVFFGKKIRSYIPFACPIYFFSEEIGEEDNYFQIPLDVFLSKEFYDVFLFGKNQKLPIIGLYNLRENQLRFLHNAWWGFTKVLTYPGNQVLNALKKEVLIEVTERNKRIESEIFKKFLKNEYFKKYYFYKILKKIFFFHSKLRMKYGKKANYYKNEIKAINFGVTGSGEYK